MRQEADRPLFDRPMLILLAMVLLFRLAMVAAYPLLTKVNPSWKWENNDRYDTIAVHWVETGTFAIDKHVPTAARLPLYPGIIALCYMVFGKAYPAAVMILQALLSTVAGFFVFRMTRRTFGRTPAMITLALYALHPQANNFVFRCATETLFIFIIAALLDRMVSYSTKGRRADLVWIGIWIGLSLLLRQTLAPLVILFVIIYLLWQAISDRAVTAALRACAISITVALLIVTPWLARNYAHSGQVPVLQTWVGQPMFQGTYVSRHLSDFFSRKKTLTDLDQEALAIVREKTRGFMTEHVSESRPIAREVIADRYSRKLALSGLMKEPFSAALHAGRNIFVAPLLQMTWKSTAILFLWNVPLLALCFIGAVICYREQRATFIKALPIVVIFSYLLMIHALIWPQARYILPGLLPFSGFAGLCLSRIAGLRLRILKDKRQ